MVLIKGVHHVPYKEKMDEVLRLKSDFIERH